MFCCNYRSLGTLYTIEFNCSTTSELGEQMLLACFVYPPPPSPLKSTLLNVNVFST